MIFLTIIAFIVIFSILILVHEIGHFVMARRSGIKVEEFGIGLPPQAKPIFKDKKGTVYSLNWIPFGGFVRMYGEDSVDSDVLKDKNSFASKTIAQRTSVILAGVTMNFLLAWVLITFGFIVGIKPFLATQSDLDTAVKNGIIETQDVLYVHNIMPDSPLDGTELKVGDAIISLNGTIISDTDSFISSLKPDTMVNLAFIRDGESNNMNVKTGNDGKLGFEISEEQLIVNIKNVKYPFYSAPIMALKEVGRLSVLTIKMLGSVVVNLLAKFTVPDGVAGPVGIAKMTHSFAKEGFMALVHFTALISISLGVINIMPFPALDGGRFLFIIFEAITKHKANAKWERIIHTTGFGLLMLLIFVITWNDIVNLFR